MLNASQNSKSQEMSERLLLLVGKQIQASGADVLNGGGLDGTH
jgi:hypothetical protein